MRRDLRNKNILSSSPFVVRKDVTQITPLYTLRFALNYVPVTTYNLGFSLTYESVPTYSLGFSLTYVPVPTYSLGFGINYL